jgi:hypothetical protein
MSWQIVAVADLDDGYAAPRPGAGRRFDIVWRDTVSGQNELWRLTPAFAAERVALPAVSDLDWQVVGTAYMVGPAAPFYDSTADLVWRNSATGEVTAWLMQGITVTSRSTLGTVPADWDLVAQTGGFFVGRTFWMNELVWRQQGTGAVTGWSPSGQRAKAWELGEFSQAPWTVAGMADLDGDVDREVLFRNLETGEYVLSTNGEVERWGDHPAPVPLASRGLDWTIVSP